MSNRHQHDLRHRRKLGIERETGAVRMPVVPQTAQDIAALSLRSGIGFDELMNLDELELGLVIHDENARNEAGDEILRVITQGADNAGVDSRSNWSTRLPRGDQDAALGRQFKVRTAGRDRSRRRA